MKLGSYIKWFEAILGQFKYGGKKYAQTSTKEATDCLFEDFGKNWLFGTLAKYCKRYSNVARERDLLKIATYCFILWLKRGFHMYREGTEYAINTTVDIKSKFFGEFKQKVFHFMGDFNTLYYKNSQEAMDKVYDILMACGRCKFQQIKEQNLFVIFALCYFVWEHDVPDDKKGQDQDINNKTDRK